MNIFSNEVQTKWSKSEWCKQISQYIEYHSGIQPSWKDKYLNYDELLEQLDYLGKNEVAPNEKKEEFFEILKEEVKKIIVFYQTKLFQFQKAIKMLKKWGNESKEFKPFQGLFRSKEKLRKEYIRLFQECEFMKSFVQLNKHAVRDILRGYASVMKGEIIEISNLSHEPFSSHKSLHFLQKQIQNDFHQQFEGKKTTTSFETTYQQLKKKRVGHSRGDVMRFSLYTGICVPFCLLIVYVLSLHPNLMHDPYFWDTFPVFRGSLCFVLLIYLMGINFFIWKRFRINHVYLFNFSPESLIMNIDYITTFKLGSMFLIVWSVCFLFFVSMLSGTTSFFNVDSKYFILLMVICFLLLAFSPFHMFNYSVRRRLFKIFWNLCITPFGKTRLRENYSADILCSLVIPIQDIGYTFFYFLTGKWGKPDAINTSEHWLYMGTWGPIIAVTPYSWRFIQSLYHALQQKKYFLILNCVKYTMCIALIFINALYRNFVLIYPEQLFWKDYLLGMGIVLVIITSISGFLWDVSMDWGLITISFDRQRYYCPKFRFLRKKIRYHKMYYIISVIYNFPARVAWTLTLTYHLFGHGRHFWAFVCAAAELVRRMNWSVIRLEWEQESNSQNFRQYKFVPDIFI